MQSGIDHIHAGITQCTSDHFNAAIVTVQTDFCQHYPNHSCIFVIVLHRVLLGLTNRAPASFQGFTADLNLFLKPF